ncbi:SusC/RagA family TonB-linked outer membrane protein [Dyadobacter sp. CY323]|uniref:SusC/RagA family TonB-linked outer membrane protein n=1 Tax=Dyadobacter sp. CY323 TaxID=2907302 RepID=UPI001F44E442|nr:SusC/RagA family TonB-linked outer membrane protein [Dyadobacter sp. CY323]MCE6990204.1 SusC/RagA family TonB-linked outer membrane protein [Dyadobacter sp. CY323]
MYGNSLPVPLKWMNCTFSTWGPAAHMQGSSRQRFKILVVLMLLGAGFASETVAQELNVTGKVVDDKGVGLPGVNVLIKGSTKGTSTDTGGGYSISVPTGSETLVFSFIGYASMDVAVSGRSVVNVTLREDATQLGEVVVTALGIERSAKTLTYATQQLSGKQLADVRDANFVNTLSGKVAGIVVTQGSSGPGSATRVTLRGNRSIGGNNNALFVVDGVPIDNSIRSQVNSDFGGVNRSDGAANINPDDIESMNVLKGPAASALYGSRAANGVIMITTKKGKAGKISTDINSGISIESPLLLPSFQNKYGQGAGGKSSENASGSWGAAATTYPDNIKNFYRNGVSTNNSIGLSGGSENIQTYMSYTHNKNQGLIPNNDLQRHTLNLRISANLTKKLSVDGKVTYINQDIKNKPYSGENSGPIMNLLKTPRSVNLDDYKNFETENGTPRYWTSSGIYMNPYWTLNRTFGTEKRDRSIILGSAKYELASWLNVQGRVSYDTYVDEYERGYANNTLLYAAAGGNYENFDGKTLERNMDLIFSGNHKIGGNFGLTYNFGAGSTYNKYSEVGGTATGLSVVNKFDLSFATNLTRVSTFSEKELQYVFGAASFSFKDYLTVDASIRNDWSSTLPNPYSYTYFSFGGNFILSEALRMPSWISFAKVRGSWAQVGNDTSPYQLDPFYTFTAGGTTGYIARNTTLPNANLKPEISSATEFGVDFRAFNGRIGLDVTYYNSNTINQILSLPLASPSGFNTQVINAGKINNTGIEIVASGKPLKGGRVSWETSVNFARNVNKVVYLNESIKKVSLGSGIRSASPIVAEGGSFGDMEANTWLRDSQGRYVVTAAGVPAVGPIATIGNYNPKFTLGWNNSFNYKNFVFSFLVDGRIGGIVTSGTEANLAFDGNSDYTEAHREGGWVLPAVTAEGAPNTKAITAEQFWQTVSQGRYSWGEFFTYSATNFRLRELTLGYNIPFSPNSFLKNARLSFTARNLFFIYRGNAKMDIPGLAKRKLPFDPDMNLGAGNFQGLDYGNLPSSRTIGLNLKLSF